MKYFIFSILKFVLLLVINKENDFWSINHNSIGNINIVKLNIFIQIFFVYVSVVFITLSDKKNY
jgi:hypothetical protein